MTIADLIKMAIMAIVDLIKSIILPLVLIVLSHTYNRISRYGYLADRWNDLMNINVDEPDFFNSQETSCYASKFDEKKRTKYHLHARIFWGFVEDVIRNDYTFERWLKLESFTAAYEDTIKECIRLHHSWLKDNKDRYFTYPKFRKVLKQKFGSDLNEVSLEI